MRNIGFILFLLLGVMPEIYAHAYCINKNVCSNGWRFKAHARTWDAHFPKISQAQSCSDSENHSAVMSKGCLFQSSENKAGRWKFTGWVSYNSCSRECHKSDLFHSTFPTTLYNSVDTLIQQCHISTGGQVNGANTLEIKHISGFMEATAEMVSSFSVKIWLPSGENDTTVSTKEIVYKGKVMLVDGKVILEGHFVDDFNPSFYSIDQVGEKTRLNFRGKNLIINLNVPNGRSIDEYVVIGETNGAYNHGGVVDRISAHTQALIDESKLEFLVERCSVKDELKIKYRVLESGVIRIGIYEENGKFIFEVTTPYLMRDEMVNISFEALGSKLKKGTYVLLLENNEKQLTKRFLIE